MANTNGNIIIINLNEFDEMEREWLKSMFKEEIDDHFCTARNEHLWSLGSSADEDTDDHEYYSNLHREHAKKLKEIIKTVGWDKED